VVQGTFILQLHGAEMAVTRWTGDALPGDAGGNIPLQSEQ